MPLWPVPRRRRLRIGAAGLALGLLSCSDDGGRAAGPPVSASVDGSVASVVEVEAAWTRPTPGGTHRSAVYAEFTSAADNELVGTSVDPAIAGTAELHETMSGDTTMPTGDGGGMMSMAPVTAVVLPAGETVTFEPGGYHAMLVDLVAPLADGDMFDLTFTFREGGDVTVPVIVSNGPP